VRVMAGHGAAGMKFDVRGSGQDFQLIEREQGADGIKSAGRCSGMCRRFCLICWRTSFGDRRVDGPPARGRPFQI